MKTKGTVWLLGASSGLGLSTTEAFVRDGWLVVAGARSFMAPQEMKKPNEMLGILHCLPLDVLDTDSCETFVQHAWNISPRVDVMCYCAGLLVLGAGEETHDSEYERVMRTNFIGMTRMVNKVLPLMRAQGGGKVVLFSSINGVLGTPFQSAYVASKHAIEGYSKCLAMELKPFHISVSVVEPGDHRGGAQAYRLRASGTEEKSVYAQEYQSACRTIHRDENGGLSPQKLGEKVVKNVNRKRMRYRLRVAKPDQRLACWMESLLPPRLCFAVLRGYYVKKGARKFEKT